MPSKIAMDIAECWVNHPTIHPEKVVVALAEDIDAAIRDERDACELIVLRHMDESAALQWGGVMMMIADAIRARNEQTEVKQ